MKKVKIYLRSINKKGEKCLALSDSEGNGDINDLVTEANPGDIVIWKMDCRSSIKGITKIYSKTGKGNIFTMEPVKSKICNQWRMTIPKDARGEEAYGIDYVLCDGSKLSIDPRIIIPLP